MLAAKKLANRRPDHIDVPEGKVLEDAVPWSRYVCLHTCVRVFMHVCVSTFSTHTHTHARARKNTNIHKCLSDGTTRNGVSQTRPFQSSLWLLTAPDQRVSIYNKLM
jgi:hypothetical protein